MAEAQRSCGFLVEKRTQVGKGVPVVRSANGREGETHGETKAAAITRNKKQQLRHHRQLKEIS